MLCSSWRPTPLPSLSLLDYTAVHHLPESYSSSQFSSNCCWWGLPFLIAMVSPSFDFLLYSLGNPLIISQSFHFFIVLSFLCVSVAYLFLYIVHFLESRSLPSAWVGPGSGRKCEGARGLPTFRIYVQLCLHRKLLFSWRGGGRSVCSKPATRSVYKAQGQVEVLGIERNRILMGHDDRES